MKYKWLNKMIAAATLSAFLLQPCMYGAEQTVYAATETTSSTPLTRFFTRMAESLSSPISSEMLLFQRNSMFSASNRGWW